MKVAAIWYVEEQNEPSHPFIIELDCALERSAIEAELKKYVEDSRDDEEDEEDVVTVEWDSLIGDITVSGDGYLIVGLDHEQRKALGLRD